MLPIPPPEFLLLLGSASTQALASLQFMCHVLEIGKQQQLGLLFDARQNSS